MCGGDIIAAHTRPAVYLPTDPVREGVFVQWVWYAIRFGYLPSSRRLRLFGPDEGTAMFWVRIFWVSVPGDLVHEGVHVAVAVGLGLDHAVLRV